jgi:hypothetical protein
MAVRTPQNPFVRSGIRLAVGMLVTDAICLYLFQDNATCLFASFATLILLYFLDFEGGARQRLLAYVAASLVGVISLIIGVYAAPITWVAVIVTVPVSFAVASARVLKGFTARCAVGLQLAFFIPVMLPATPTRIDYYLGGWLVGCVIAIICALTVLPRQRLTLTRDALADWCTAAGTLTRLYAANSHSGEGKAGLEAAYEEIQKEAVGSPTRPGSLTLRLRALLQMVQYANSSTKLAMSTEDLGPDAHVSLLADASTKVFDSSASILKGDSLAPSPVDMDALRHRDLMDAQKWCAEGLEKNPAKTLDELRAHYPIRLIAIGAAVMQWLALRSRGKETPMPEIGAFESSSPLELLRVNFRLRSPWFLNALRTGLAAAIAVGLAQGMGLKHGFWVVLATISILQLSFSSPQTGRIALKTMGGTVAGILVGAALVLIAPIQPVFLILLAVTAFLAKFAQSKSITWSQFAFSPLAIINVSLLTWPPSTDTALSRLIDIFIGLAVAVVLTLAIFPRGIGQLITSTGKTAMTSMQAYVDAVRDVITGRASAASLDAKRTVALRSLQAYDDTLDAAFMTARTVTPEISAFEAQQGWLQDALLAGDVLRNLVGQSDELVKVPEIVAALDLPQGDRLDRMREVVVKDHERLALHPHAFVSAVWSGWWLDFLDRTKPADSPVSAKK